MQCESSQSHQNRGYQDFSSQREDTKLPAQGGEAGRSLASKGEAVKYQELPVGVVTGQSIKAGPKPHRCNPSNLEWDLEEARSGSDPEQRHECPHHSS